MKKRITIYLALMILVPVSVLAFDYDLNFYGMDAPNLSTIGCQCETQAQFELFYGEYLKDVAEYAHFERNLDTGILRRNTTDWFSKGFMSTYTALNLEEYLTSMGSPRSWEGFVVYVGWPEFGE